MATAYNVIKLNIGDIKRLVVAAGLVPEGEIEGVFLGKSHNTLKADMQYATLFNKDYEYVMLTVKSPKNIPSSVEVEDLEFNSEDDRLMI